MERENIANQINAILHQLRNIHGMTMRDTAKFISYAISALKSAESNLTHFEHASADNKDYIIHRVRNLEATCATCPYCKDNRICCRNAMTATGNEFGITGPGNWCGEHPDFWKEADETMKDVLND